MYGAKPCMGSFWSGAARLAFLFRLGTGKEGPPLSPAAGMGGGERKQAVQIKQQERQQWESQSCFWWAWA